MIASLGHYAKTIFAIIISLCLKLEPGLARPGKLILVENAIEHEISSKECNSGIFLPAPTAFTCACVTGVWAFYREFCEKPELLIGGDQYCFNMADIGKITQVALVGSYRYPFEPSISHFFNTDFVQLSTYITASEYKAMNMDALGGWISVMNEKWTLYSDKGESVCLAPIVSGKRIFCTFAKILQSQINNDKWNYIVKVKLGCYSNATVNADACYPIKQNNGKEGCQFHPNTSLCDKSDNDDACSEPRLELRGPGSRILNLSDEWLPKPQSDPVSVICTELTRDAVKQYWLDPANNECGKSIVEAIFKDQLQRFAVTRLDKIFDSRLESLEQVKQLVYRSRDIIKKTCGRAYVPDEFLDVATDAFMMFISEDFFYGVEGAESENFGRILKSLEKCYKRAKLFVFETKPLDCDLNKITGTLILPGEKVNLTIPDMGKSKRFETLIETAWKMFLNSHSYCFEDFQFPNDHHQFSVMFLELFSRSIYEKWIEPLANKQLYKLILPHFGVMNQIMENLDYCVAAVKHVSPCPVWLRRSGPNAKPIEAGDSLIQRSNKDGGNDEKSKPLSRKKRSWVDEISLARNRAKTWGGMAYCLQYMEEPSVSLALAGCNEVF